MKNLIFPLLFPITLFSQGPSTTDNHIKVDQFGYRPNDKKIVVISNPVTGYNSNQPFTPGTTYQVRKWSDNSIVFSAAPVSWKTGTTHAQSGDKVWWFDFTSVSTAGSYFVFDPTNNAGSYRFEINDCVYNDALKHSSRSFYYQRCGIAHPSAYAGSAWEDNTACHISTQQDKDCRLYNNTNVSTSKDLSGGWHDAGDYNKYVNFAWGATLDLLMAYDENPTVWGDDWNIPESGNSIPDILDEIKYELDWLLKMQQGNGSVLCVVGGGSGSPPSADNTPRRYGPATTSATYTSASLFALGAVQFKKIGQTAYAATLQTAAEKAWTWAQANPNITFNNAGILAAGEQEVDSYGILSRQIASACFLYALTGTSTYKTFFDNNYAQVHLIQWSFAYPFESTQQDVLLYYTKITGATTGVATNIKNKYLQSLSTTGENLPSFTNSEDAYRAYIKDADYGWGSNSTKSKKANMYLNMKVYNLDAANTAKYSEAALGYVNYMHGINPTAFTYLSNMGNYGAENSIREFYHSWFSDGSAKWDRVGSSTYGPAPGFLPGGPNPGYSLDGCCPSGCGGSNSLCVNQSPPSGQPQQKSYKDWNTSWPQNSWEVTENGIYYQAAYIHMLSKFVSSSCITTATASSPRYDKEIRLIPNPAKETTTILLPENTQESNMRVSIHDITGRTMNTLNTGNTSSILFDLKNLKPGIYFISLEGNEIHSVHKVVKE